MVEEDFAVVASVREVVLEVDLAAQGDVATELVPLRQTHGHRLLEHLFGNKRGQRQRGTTTDETYLDEGQHLLDISPRIVECGLLLVHLDRHLLNRRPLPTTTHFTPVHKQQTTDMRYLFSRSRSAACTASRLR